MVRNKLGSIDHDVELESIWVELWNFKEDVGMTYRQSNSRCDNGHCIEGDAGRVYKRVVK